MDSKYFDARRRAEINFEVKSISAQRSTARVGGILALSNPTHCEMRHSLNVRLNTNTAPP